MSVGLPKLTMATNPNTHQTRPYAGLALNRATWHFAKNDYHGHRREMHRITVEGEPLHA